MLPSREFVEPTEDTAIPASSLGQFLKSLLLLVPSATGYTYNKEAYLFFKRMESSREDLVCFMPNWK